MRSACVIASKARALERLTGRTPPLLFGALAAEFKSQPANYRSEGELTFSDKEKIRSAVVDPPDTLSIWGMAICMDGDRGGGSEPFAAKLEIADDGSSLRSYAMWFGDADAGLGRSDKRYRRRLVRDDPPRWLFEFRSPPTLRNAEADANRSA